MSNTQNGTGAGSHSEADLAQVSLATILLLCVLTARVGVQGIAARRADCSRPGEPPRLDRKENRGPFGSSRKGRAGDERHSGRE
jgi:hypothetical protein